METGNGWSKDWSSRREVLKEFRERERAWLGVREGGAGRRGRGKKSKDGWEGRTAGRNSKR